MGKNRRVVVTGMGAITPIGNSVEEFWNGIKEGKTGFGPITYFDTADYRCKLAAEVKDFDPAQYMDKKSARRMEQFCQFAVAAAGQAISDAGLDMEQEDPYMVGCSNHIQALALQPIGNADIACCHIRDHQRHQHGAYPAGAFFLQAVIFPLHGL